MKRQQQTVGNILLQSIKMFFEQKY